MTRSAEDLELLMKVLAPGLPSPSHSIKPRAFYIAESSSGVRAEKEPSGRSEEFGLST